MGNVSIPDWHRSRLESRWARPRIEHGETSSNLRWFGGLSSGVVSFYNLMLNDC